MREIESQIVALSKYLQSLRSNNVASHMAPETANKKKIESFTHATALSFKHFQSQTKINSF